MMAVVTFYEFVDVVFGEDGYVAASLVGPLLLVAVLGYGGWRMLRADAKCIWTAMFWFRLSTATYFGLGTYSVYIVNSVTRMYLQTFHLFFESEVFRLNRLVAFSVLIVLIFSRIILIAQLHSRLHQDTGGQSTEDQAAAMNRLKAMGITFLVMGMAVTYLIKLPYDFGFVQYEWPGSIVGLSRMTMLGIFMLALWSLERAPPMLPVIAGITALEMIVQLLLFAKSGIVMTLVMFLLAFLWKSIGQRLRDGC